ncbi:MAG: hotdog fold thioesterase [Candidatus Eisenbacteria bacterium]|nr:hotdog fold thioesterase [Candidatus Latescibacterota bacterium]MBD3302442.1 hotdog fold thioesterase [Candidatus Eisenbacteria bacterium]
MISRNRFRSIRSGSGSTRPQRLRMRSHGSAGSAGREEGRGLDRSDNERHVPPRDDRYCFVCGRENPHGLHTTWTLDPDGAARTRFEPARHHQGWVGVVHGGILAALLDEAMAQRMWLDGKPAVTANLSIRYRRPVPTSGVLLAEARIVSEKSRTARLEAVVRDERGEPYVEAEGTCMRIAEE